MSVTFKEKNGKIEITRTCDDNLELYEGLKLIDDFSHSIITLLSKDSAYDWNCEVKEVDFGGEDKIYHQVYPEAILKHFRKCSV